MDVKQLQPKQGNVDIVLDVVDVGDVREFQKFGKPGRVATAQAKDTNGDIIKLTLWNEDIEKVKAGDKVHLVNGYVNEWQGELQLSTGRSGKLEIVERDAQQDTPVYRNYPPEEDDKTINESPDVDEEDVEEI